MAALFYPGDGPPALVHPANGTDFQLEELYQRLGCRAIEVVALPHGWLVCDEYGKLSDPPKPPNPLATWVAWLDGAIDTTDYIAGPALICERGQLR